MYGFRENWKTGKLCHKIGGGSGTMRKKPVAQVNNRLGGNPNHNLGRLYACGGALPLKYLKGNMSKSVKFF